MARINDSSKRIIHSKRRCVKIKNLKDLKDYRGTELKYYTIANVIIIMWLYGLQQGLYVLQEGQHVFSFIGKDVPLEKIITNLIEIGLFSSVLYVYVFILDSVIPSQLKYNICYLFFFHKPGYSIFTKIRNNGSPDARFAKEDALKLYADVYNKIDNVVISIDNSINSSNGSGNCGNSCGDKGEIENSSWYRIYSKYRNDEMVFSSNQDYLLCRDLCIMTILMLIFYLSSCFILSETPNCRVVIFLAIEIVITDAAFWIRGNRLAYNVISLDISEKLNDSTNIVPDNSRNGDNRDNRNDAPSGGNNQ